MPNDDYIATAEAAIKFIFSWVILLPIAIIVSGKFLTKPVSFSVNSKQLFKIEIGILTIQATDEEVILGFAGFIITLFASAMYSGKGVYELVKAGFGIDPGQFNSLCIFSSFSMVVWSCALLIITELAKHLFSGPRDKEMVERDKLIEQLRKEREEESQ